MFECADGIAHRNFYYYHYQRERCSITLALYRTVCSLCKKVLEKCRQQSVQAIVLNKRLASSEFWKVNRIKPSVPYNKWYLHWLMLSSLQIFLPLTLRQTRKGPSATWLPLCYLSTILVISLSQEVSRLINIFHSMKAKSSDIQFQWLFFRSLIQNYFQSCQSW